MTTIAWDGDTVAADRQETYDGRTYPRTKLIEKPDGTVLGITGDVYAAMLYCDWYGTKKKFPWDVIKDSEFEVLIVTPHRAVYTVDGTNRPIEVEDDYIALGSGSVAAMAAMMRGANAVEAIEVASQLDPYTNNAVDSITLDTS